MNRTFASRLGTGARVGLSFGLLIMLIIGVGWLTLHQMSRNEADLEKIVDVHWASVQLARRAQAYSNQNSRLTLQMFISDDPKDIYPLSLQMAQNSEQVARLIETLRSRVRSSEEKQLLNRVEETRTPYVESYQHALRLLTLDKKPDEARALMINETLPRLSPYHAAWNTFVEFQGREMDDAQGQNARGNARARMQAIVLISATIIIAFLIALFVTRHTTLRLAQRQQAERALQSAHDELEVKIKERTAELNALNDDLQKEAAERRLVESALRSSELRYRNIVEGASEPIYRISPKGHFTFVNPTAAALVKRSVEECLGLHYLSLVREDYRSQTQETYAGQIRERIPVTYFEFPSIASDGSTIWIGQNVQLVVENDHLVELQGIARDITTRKQIEEQLVESEHRYRLLFESNPQPMWVFDVTTLAFLAVNDAAVRHYGYSREEFLGMTIKDIRPAEDVELLIRRRADSTGNFGEYSSVWRHRKKDGSLIEVEISWHTLDFSGRPAKLVLANDVTERRRSEAALSSERTLLRTLVDALPDRIYAKDLESRFLLNNKSHIKALGAQSQEEVTGKTDFDFRPSELAAQYLADEQNVMRTGEPLINREDRAAHAPNETNWLLVTKVPLRGPQGSVVGVVGISRDITEWKKAESEVLLQTARFQQLFENAPLGILQVDRDDRIVDANKEFESIFQYSLSDIKGRFINDVVVPPESLGEGEALSSGTLRGESVQAETLRRRRDGTLINVQIFGVPILVDQRPVGVFAIYIDLTEQRKAETDRARLAGEIESQRERLNNILSSIPCVVWESWIDPDSTSGMTFVNSYVEKMYGYTVDEWLSTPDFWLTTVHPEDRQRVSDSDAELIAKGSVRDELRRITKDGRVVWGENQVVVVKDDSGKPVGIRGITTDITERKRAEASSRASERRYRDLFAFAPVGIYRAKPDGSILAANKTLAEMLGYDSVDEFLKVRLDRDIYADPEERGKPIGKYKNQGHHGDLEIRWKKKNGDLIWVELTEHTIKGANDPADCYEGFVRDITERKRMEDEREVISEIIQSVINTSDLNDVLSLVHRSIGKCLNAENCFVALLDEDTDLMHFSFWVDKFDPCPEPRPVGVGFSSLVLKSGQATLVGPKVTEQMYRRGEVEKSGSSSASWLGVPLRTPARTIGVLVVQHYEDENAYDERDLEFLTSVGSQVAMAIERKRAEKALNEANQRALSDYERLVERISSLGQTLGSARELKSIFRALRAFAAASVPCDGLAISLYSPERESRRVVYCWTDDEELALTEAVEAPVGNGMTGQAIKSGAVMIDNRFKAKVGGNGKPVLLGAAADNTIERSALTAPMTVMGKTVGCVEIQSHHPGAFKTGHATAMRMAANMAANAVENVMLIEREQLKEEQLRQAQKMESIGKLAGGIAHDFNNLMTAVTGYSELLLNSLGQDDSLRPKIEEIKKAGDRAASLTRQLLAFSRKQMLQPKTLDLNEVVAGMAKMLVRVIGEDIDLRLELEDTLGKVKADPGQIEQVILNLGVNARDAMVELGGLTIKTENIYVNERIGQNEFAVEPGNYVLMSVADTGCGMDAETLTRIFEPFFTTKEVGKGTGLGLSTVYGIVKQSGGHILVDSEVGQGTIFKVYLPRVYEIVGDEMTAERTKPVPSGEETVLLVEDEKVVRDLTKEILEYYGYSVLIAANGCEGLRVAKDFAGRIDLAITDVIMPQMSGREFAKGLKELRPETGVLYMSGFTDDSIIYHGVLEEGVFFIQKPFSPDGLALKAREVLDRTLRGA